MQPKAETKGEDSSEFVFEELRYQEERARSEEEVRDSRLSTLVALSGPILGLLVASLPDGRLSAAAIAFFFAAILSFGFALLIAIQATIRLSFASRPFGGSLEKVPEVGEPELVKYLTEGFQRSNPDVLRVRVMGVMRSAISSRRRNIGRKERCIEAAIRCVVAGVVAGAIYVAILVL